MIYIVSGYFTSGLYFIQYLQYLLQRRPVNGSAVLQAKNWTNSRAFMFWTINQAISTICSTIECGQPKIEQLHRWTIKRAPLY